jgi:hypothetical protein
MIVIALFVGCEQPVGPCATPMPAQAEAPIRHDEKEEAPPMNLEFANMRFASQNEQGLWGFRDVLGEWVIEPKYSNVHNFKEDIATVATVQDGDEYWGYVNKMGREVIELKYSYVRDFLNGLAFVREKNGNDEGTMSNKYIDTDGVEVINLDTDITEGFEFDDEGMAVVCKQDGEHSRYGVIDREGNFLISFNKGFMCISEMHGKHFSAIPVEPVSGEQKTGVIDAKGEWIIQPKYDEVQVLANDRVLVGIEDKKGQKCEIISLNGEVISKLGYGCPQLVGEYPVVTVHDMFVFQKVDEELPLNELYDTDGNKLLGGKYQMMSILSKDIIFVADQESGGYLVSKDGEKVVDADHLYGAMRISDDIIKIWGKLNSENGLYNFKQNIWIANPIYDKILYYNGTQGEAIRDVKKADGNVTFVIDIFDNKGEVLTTRGETIIESEYDEMIENIVDITLRYESLV